VAGLGQVREDRRFAVWKALGALHAGQNDPAAARRAYAEYARLRPDDAEPRLLLLDLAIGSGDESAIAEAVESLKGLGGPDSPHWRLARVQELLRERRRQSPDPARLDEAARLIGEARAADPRSAVVAQLEARLAERRGRTAEAVAAYERALGLNGGQTALAPLVALLSRDGRDADLERVRMKVPALAAELDRFAALQAMKQGDKGRAERLAARAVETAPDRTDLRLWQARLLAELGKAKESEEALRALTVQRPEDPAPWLQLVADLVARKRPADAAATVEQIRSRVKTDRPELLWAQCYQLAGDRAGAAESYQAALKRWPRDPAVLAAAVGYLEQSGQQSEAERLLREALRRDPELSWATRKLALLLAGRRGDREAWADALRLVGPDARPGDTPDDRLTRAYVYAQGAEPARRDQAVRILERLAAERPRESAVHERLARLLLTSGRKAEAREHAARAAEGDGTTADAVLLYAGLLVTEKSLDEAERQLARLAALDPDGLPVVELRARIAAAKGRGAEAAEVLERAFARVNAPEALAVGEPMVGLLLELKQPDAAERVSHKLAAFGPRGRCVLAELLAGRGKSDEAVALVEAVGRDGGAPEAARAALALATRPQADPRWIGLADRLLDATLKADPGSADVLFKQAVLRRLQGRHREEVELYRQVLARSRGNTRLLNDLAWALSEDLNQPREGLERAEEALRRVGWQPHILDTRGVILTRLDRLDDAIKDLETAARDLPIGPVYYHLARAYEKKGRADEFRKCLDRARGLGLTAEQLQPSERDDWARVARD
jgi:tetratricopeptide (TPR) repeat protein